ncbi:MAG: PIN domain-containing protein [Candidatus Diapherotrites archaeon]|nr:PIN domain-containing protein [Candidatus Diapherotrites archaeon]
MNKILVDTNILFYLVQKHETKKHEIVSKLFKTIREKHQESNYTIALQSLREFSNIYWKKSKEKNLDDLIENIQLFKTVFEILPETEEDIETANKLHFEQKIPFWDALIVSVMQKNHIDSILTENEKDFKKIPWTNVINPFKNLHM